MEPKPVVEPTGILVNDYLTQLMQSDKCRSKNCFSCVPFELKLQAKGNKKEMLIDWEIRFMLFNGVNKISITSLST